jgi:hypothetical protein
MGMARRILERLAIGIGHRQARDCHRLASQGIPTVLEVEGSPSERTTLRVAGSHRSHSSDELGESWRRNPLYGAVTKILAPVSNNMAQTKVDLNFFAAVSQQLFTTQTKLLEETSVLNSPRQLSSSKLADTLANPFPIKPVGGELLFRPYFLRISRPAMASWHRTRRSATIALRVNC